MLDSQRPHNVRNIRTTVPGVIRTKEPRQTMTEDSLLSGWPDDALAYRRRTTGNQTSPRCGMKAGNIGGYHSLGAYVMSRMDKGEWVNTTEMIKRCNIGYDQTRNALDRLFTNGKVEKRIVRRESGGGRVTEYRPATGSADPSEREMEVLLILGPQALTTDQIVKAIGLSIPRVSAILGAMKKRGWITKEMITRESGGGRRALWRAKQ